MINVIRDDDKDVEDFEAETEEPTTGTGVGGSEAGSVLDHVRQLHARGPQKRRDNELLQLIEEAL